MSSNEISTTAMSELNDLFAAIQAQDYTNALKHHSNLVKTDFHSQYTYNIVSTCHVIAMSSIHAPSHHVYVVCLLVVSCVMCHVSWCDASLCVDNNDWLLGLRTVLNIAKKQPA